MDRRSFLATGATAALLPLAETPAIAAVTSKAGSGDAKLNAAFDEIFQERVRNSPTLASSLGLDKGPNAALKSKFDTDPAPVARAKSLTRNRKAIARLRAISPAALSGAAKLNREVVLYSLETSTVAPSRWNIDSAQRPYPITQQGGSYFSTPDFLNTSHTIDNAADAEAYLSRLNQFATLLDNDTAEQRAQAARGFLAPKWSIDLALGQMRKLRGVPAEQSSMVDSITKRTAAKGIGGDWARQASNIVSKSVYPALDRQIAELKRQRPQASADAGVWRLPKGDAYYAWALRAGTTSDLDPAQVHQMGLEQLSELQARMEPLLRAQGLTQGTPGERMTALGKDTRNLFPNTDAGRDQILAYVNERLADIRTRLPRAFATLGPGNLQVKRVPPAIENGAPDGYAGPGTIDGSQPGLYYINLRDTSIWPKYALPTLSYHEGIPGHVWQGEYTYKLPLIRSLLEFNAYSEGWALYAEQLADELGVYEGDPLGKLGYLQSLAFRACRLVVDTGIHAKRWTREQAINWFATTNGSTVMEVSAEVDRYCAWPGQACGYKVGHTQITRLRDQAQKQLGARFDLRLFNDAIVRAGSVPMTLLPKVIDSYLAPQLKSSASPT